MVPFQVGDKWLIAREPYMVPVKPIPGSVSPPVGRLTHGGGWTGEKWSLQTSSAKLFSTREEAAEYLELHRETITATKLGAKNPASSEADEAKSRAHSQR
ncbi:MAG: hypothetical protein IAF94_11205 [Pirellulaceae bacterium]|nr:hypothetical protein [Pirellulaceae bacterium]